MVDCGPHSLTFTCWVKVVWSKFVCLPTHRRSVRGTLGNLLHARYEITLQSLRSAVKNPPVALDVISRWITIYITQCWWWWCHRHCFTAPLCYQLTCLLIFRPAHFHFSSVKPRCRQKMSCLYLIVRLQKNQFIIENVNFKVTTLYLIMYCVLCVKFMQMLTLLLWGCKRNGMHYCNSQCWLFLFSFSFFFHV